MTTIANTYGSPSLSRSFYWVATAYVAITSLVAGLMDLMRVEPLFGILIHLGYPAYFAAILGTWKVLGAIALTAPRYPRVKEWAYAGLFIDFTAAIASHAAMGDDAVSQIGPTLSLGLVAASWWLRPASRRLA
jgi:hypothetical protein